MKVGIDYHPAVTHAPGVGRYARELVRALVRLQDAPDLFLADIGRGPRTIGEPALGLADAPRKPRLVRSGQGRKLFTLLRRTADGVLGGVDVFHRMHADWPPVGKARELLGIAELPAPKSAEDAALRSALARAGAIVFSSHAEGLVRERYGLAAERVHKAPVGCDHWCRDLAGAAPARKHPPEILVLGALNPRRRPERVLRAVELLKRKRRPFQVLFVGPRTEASEAFLRDELPGSIARELVLWNANAAERDMARILAAASVMVHLCDEELTAVTPLEGFAFGLPVVASRLPAFEEALGSHATLLTPDEEAPEPLARALEAALDQVADDAAAERRRAIAREHTWARNAAATVEVYRRVAHR